MESFWGKVKDIAQESLNVASTTSKRAKLNVELKFIERDINRRIRAFGVEIYPLISKWIKQPEFYASENVNTSTMDSIRTTIVYASKEVLALEAKIGELEMEEARFIEERRDKFHSVSSSKDVMEGLKNVGDTVQASGGEAKVKAELALRRSEISRHKQDMGVKLYKSLGTFESDNELFTGDQSVRSCYDKCRKEVEDLKQLMGEKKKTISELDTNSY